MSNAPTATAAAGPISSASKGIKTIDVSKAPIPVPALKAGERCFRSRSRGFVLMIHDTKPREIDGHVLPGDVKLAQFTAQSGFFEGQVYDFGEIVTADPEVIEKILAHPEYNRFIWDAVTRSQSYAVTLKKDRIAELRGNPELMAAVKAELFDLGETPAEAAEVKRGPGRPRKVEAEAPEA